MVDGRKTGKSYIACKIVQNRRVMGCTHINLHKKVEFSIFLFFNSTM